MTSLYCPKVIRNSGLRAAIGNDRPLLLPTTTQRLVKLHIVLQFRVPRLGQAQRRKEVLLFVVLHFEKTGDATLAGVFPNSGLRPLTPALSSEDAVLLLEATRDKVSSSGAR